MQVTDTPTPAPADRPDTLALAKELREVWINGQEKLFGTWDQVGTGHEEWLRVARHVQALPRPSPLDAGVVERLRTLIEDYEHNGPITMFVRVSDLRHLLAHHDGAGEPAQAAVIADLSKTDELLGAVYQWYDYMCTGDPHDYEASEDTRLKQAMADAVRRLYARGSRPANLANRLRALLAHHDGAGEPAQAATCDYRLRTRDFCCKLPSGHEGSHRDGSRLAHESATDFVEVVKETLASSEPAKAEAAKVAAEPPGGAGETLAIQRIRHFFGGDSCTMPSVELKGLHDAANADPDEGAEWLPYYKMALNRLVECCGVLRSMAGKVLTPAQFDLLIHEAGRLYYEHLLLGGVGPKRDKDCVRRSVQAAAAALSVFVDAARAAK